MRIALALAFATIGLSAHADLFKCVGADRKVSYQAEPCAAGGTEKRIRAPGADGAEKGPNGVGLIDVGQAARRIGIRSGRPTVVLLYATGCSLSQQMFPGFVEVANRYRARGVDFVVLSTDDEDRFKYVSGFLAKRNAPFEPLAIKPWQPGQLTASLRPVGIEIGSTWMRPLVAVRDRDGRVVHKTEGEVQLASLRATLDRLAR